MSTWTSQQLADSTCHGSLTLNGLSMNNSAWASLNNYVLWPPANRRGSNIAIPGRSGRIAVPRRKDETSRTLECLVIGDCDITGTPYASRSVGLATNCMLLDSSLFGWTGTSVAAVLTLPNGAVRSGAVQIVHVEYGSPGVEGVLTFTLDIDIPDGELT